MYYDVLTCHYALQWVPGCSIIHILGLLTGDITPELTYTETAFRSYSQPSREQILCLSWPYSYSVNSQAKFHWLAPLARYTD